MKRHRIFFAAFLFILTALFSSSSTVAAQEKAPLVSLDALNLSEGELTAWDNAGSLKGSFKNEKKTVQVKVVDGVKGVVFNGKDVLNSDIVAPASLTGDKPWTCIVQTRCTDISGERALVSWSPRPENALEIEYGDALQWGAVGTWNDPNTIGWGGNLPKTKKWHTLIYRYTGGTNGDLEAWCDGKLCNAKKVTLATKSNKKFTLGACATTENSQGYIHYIVGAIANVQVYDRAFSPLEIWQASGKKAAFYADLGIEAAIKKTHSTNVTLKWFAGSPDVASFDVYVGDDREAVEKADNQLQGGTSNKFNPNFAGNQPGSETNFGPVHFELGKTYYWRVDELDASGKLAWRGDVATLAIPSGNASKPTPDNAYIVVEGSKPKLSWKPGEYAVKQNIYFGATADEVAAKKKPDIADLPPETSSAAIPVALPEAGKSLYWRVESINGEGLPVSSGEVWSFRTVHKKMKVYLSGGQSNCVGCTPVKGLDEKYRGIQKGTIIFVRGESKVAPYGWAYLQEGLGSSYSDIDGQGSFGPELLFGIDMQPTDPADVIAIIKCGWGGTNLDRQWRPPSAGGRTGELYTNFVAAVKEGMAALDPAFEPELVGMLWMQGESDTADEKMAENYEKNLTCLINDIRAETKRPDLLFVLAQITKAPAWEAKGLGVKVRDAEEAVAKKVPHTAMFPTADLKIWDPWHYDVPGMIVLGQRFAETMKKLEKEK